MRTFNHLQDFGIEVGKLGMGRLNTLFFLFDLVFVKYITDNFKEVFIFMKSIRITNFNLCMNVSDDDFLFTLFRVWLISLSFFLSQRFARCTYRTLQEISNWIFYLTYGIDIFLVPIPISREFSSCSHFSPQLFGSHVFTDSECALLGLGIEMIITMTPNSRKHTLVF